MLKNETRKQIIKTLDDLTEYGPKWREGRDVHHLDKRKKRGHIPLDWSLKNYNQFIVGIAKELGNETYLYYKETFEQQYLVIGNKYWIVIMGIDGIMETAFPPNDYTNYLSEKEGYQYLGTIREVRFNAL